MTPPNTSTNADGSGSALACLHVRAGGARLALAFEAVQEYAEIGPWVPVPGARDWCLGLVQWRGRLLSLLDAGRLFGRAASSAGHQVVLAGLPIETVLAVDELVDVFPADEPADVHLDLAALRAHEALATGAAGGAAER